MLEKIIKDLGDNYNENDREVLKNLMDEVISISFSISNRTYEDMQPLNLLIENTTKALYLKRGAEGMTSSNYNGESNSFDDIIDKLKRDIISSGLRLPF